MLPICLVFSCHDLVQQHQSPINTAEVSVTNILTVRKCLEYQLFCELCDTQICLKIIRISLSKPRLIIFFSKSMHDWTMNTWFSVYTKLFLLFLFSHIPYWKCAITKENWSTKIKSDNIHLQVDSQWGVGLG